MFLQEVAVSLASTPETAPVKGYYNCTYQPWHNAQGEVTGLIAIAIDVTRQVLARQQVEAKEQHAHFANGELQRDNKAILARNAELERTQQELRQLNENLEARVLAQTQELRRVQLATKQERAHLYQVFEQMPAAIAIMRGPELRVELANPAVAAIWGRKPEQVLGKPYFEAVPDTAGQGFEQILSDVLATGQPFTITEAPVTLARKHTGLPTQAYVNFVFQPLKNEVGDTVGLIASGTEVTEQVLARYQVHQLNQELAASNEALEARVLARTQELQLAQQDAERQRGELQRIFEQAPVAIALYRGPHYIIELANPTVCALWGRTPAQTVGAPLFAVLPEVAGQGYEELLDQVRLTGKPHEAREMASTINRNGRLETVYWDFVYLPTYEPDGTISGVMVVASEVTDQVMARQQLEQLNHQLDARVRDRTRQLEAQQNLLRRILGQVPASVATLSGPEHRFSFFNDHYLTLTAGRPRLGAMVAEVLPEVAEQGFIELLDNVYTTGQLYHGREISALLHDPHTGQDDQRYLDFIYQPLLDGQGQTQGILVFALDITKQVLSRRQADTLQAAVLAAVRRQKEERENVFQLFEQAPAVICLLRGPDHRVEYLNPAYQALFPEQALRGRTMLEIQPDAAPLLSLFDGVYASGTTQFQPEIPITTFLEGQEPTTRYFDFTYQAYREEDHIAGVAIFGLDVTEQVLAHQRVQELNEELQISNKELGAINQQLTRTNADLDTFVYTASHDLKVPIANIEGLLDALSRDLRNQSTSNSVARILGMMKEAVVRFQQTIGHLTDISRLQQESSPEVEPMGLAAIVADVQLDLAPLLEMTAARVTVELAGTPELPLSPKNLRSVVYNLLSNALKYRHPSRIPDVRVHSWQDATHVLLVVQDNGLGLDERQQQRLFGLFQRLHSHIEGSGVGLYMVKRIVENAGGTVQVRSESGVGSTFTVTLPLVR
ncbi:PAS domain-containing sensor histidine kinase [Hymenobacter mucosus]|uniref:histidine kinase n=1 Tax=Hymenobacter mucosus TaxID=1411120 RepID=A0A238Z837_9BACT|nr:PAS domain-containing protein [Hymenobacter mucosus]SNR79272.1 PAS domain S-box-containing protein [Hymenobacter mucosus]